LFGTCCDINTQISCTRSRNEVVGFVYKNRCPRKLKKLFCSPSK
jgi:hypothetical protein